LPLGCTNNCSFFFFLLPTLTTIAAPLVIRCHTAAKASNLLLCVSLYATPPRGTFRRLWLGCRTNRRAGLSQRHAIHCVAAEGGCGRPWQRKAMARGRGRR
jgi:hypothetical protein